MLNAKASFVCWWNIWLHHMKSHRISKINRIHPLRAMNMYSWLYYDLLLNDLTWSLDFDYYYSCVQKWWPGIHDIGFCRNTPIFSNSFWLLAHAKNATYYYALLLSWWPIGRYEIKRFSKCTHSPGKVGKLLLTGFIHWFLSVLHKFVIAALEVRRWAIIAALLSVSDTSKNLQTYSLQPTDTLVLHMHN